MILDTRPTLTARWKELERKGWEFAIMRTMIDFDGSVMKHSKRLIGVHPRVLPTLTADVKIPMGDGQEEEYLRWYEDNSL